MPNAVLYILKEFCVALMGKHKLTKSKGNLATVKKIKKCGFEPSSFVEARTVERLTSENSAPHETLSGVLYTLSNQFITYSHCVFVTYD